MPDSPPAFMFIVRWHLNGSRCDYDSGFSVADGEHADLLRVVGILIGG